MALVENSGHGSRFHEGDQNLNLPEISFVIPVYNAGDMLQTCLESIFRQDYPDDKFEVLVIDGGSVDNTVNVAKKFPVRLIYNSERRADHGNFLGVKSAKGSYIVILAADNEIPSEDWLRKLTKPVIEHPDLAGVIPLPVSSPMDPPINVYYTLLKTDPLTFFVFDSFGNLFDAYKPVEKCGEYYVYRFPKERCPLIGLAQGFMVRRNLVPDSINFDDTAPFCEMVAKGYKFAVTPDGVYHYHLKSLRHFVRKYIFRSKTRPTLTVVKRSILFTKRRKMRLIMWFIYSLSLIWPSVDSVKGYIKKANRAWFYHPIACLLIALIDILCALSNPRGIYSVLKWVDLVQ